jgi:hypothetical protein
VLLADDLIRSSVEANSPAYLDSLFEIWQSTIRTRLQPGAVVIAANTVWGAGDPLQRIRRSPDAVHWDFIDLPVLAPASGDPYLGRQPGEALWPEQFDEKALAEIRSAVGESTFQSLYLCRPDERGAGSKVFYAFDARQHVQRVDYDPSAELWVALDWNCSPATAILAMVSEKFAPDAFLTNRKIYSAAVLEEISLPSSNTPELLAEVRERLLRYRGPNRVLSVNVTGDSAGNQKKSSAENTDWELCRKMFADNQDYFRGHFFIEKSNPPQRDSAERVCGLLRDSELKISGNCRELILDLEKLTYKTDSQGLSTSTILKSATRGHWSDSLRYLCWQIAKPRSQWGEQPESLF